MGDAAPAAVGSTLEPAHLLARAPAHLGAERLREQLRAEAHAEDQRLDRDACREQRDLVGEVRVAVGLVRRLVAAEHHDEVGREGVERRDILVRRVDRHDLVAVRLERRAEVAEPDRRVVAQHEGGAAGGCREPRGIRRGHRVTRGP